MKIDRYNWFHNKAQVQNKVIGANNFTYRNTIEVLCKYTQFKNGGLKILDYGCGVGTVDFFLAKHGNVVYGVDISTAAIRNCIESSRAMGLRLLTKFKIINKKLPREIVDQKFDLILCSEVIEHVPDDRDLIVRLKKLLRKKGILILSTPSINAPLYRLNLANHFDTKVGHLRRYNPDELTKFVESINLRVIDTIKTEGILRNSLFLFPLLGRLVKFLKGPISDAVTLLDKATITTIGESNFYIIAQKI